MESRQIKLIDTSGRHGMPAPEFMGDRPAEAMVGQCGLHGRSAGTPTAGTPGTDIRIRLAYVSEEVGVVQVVGEGPHTGQAWKVARDENIVLKTAGGNGGAGGRGEDGQAGGRGRDGRNATKYRNGENGEDGAPGGNGGYGSNGADGAAGGVAFVTVHEGDTDLLLPLIFDVKGGDGGISGQHGEPGDGGIGGRGGDGYAWTETNSAHSRPGGSNGRNGAPGQRPSTYLSGGKSGPNGSVQIKVIRGDLSEATYPGVYCLQVTKFDIIDENEDGINEPGEHIHVHNIRVKNVGAMPSPEERSIHLLIQGTQFLNPITSEPIELPRSIQPGQEVEVPGVLRAFIRNETKEKPLGLMLKATEYVRIVAFFNERLNRPIPNFCGQTAIFVQYPLVLDAPTYLECVAKGDKVRFKWVLHNNSTKTYGIEGGLRRGAATKLSDPNGFFTLDYATADKPNEASDELSEIEPHSQLTIDQDFQVSPKTMEYSEGNLSLELMLSDPKTGNLRSVQKHMMHMQISGKYLLSQNPSFLLVVNSKTPNHAIHQIIFLIRHRLHTSLDIFNLSLTGSYESPMTGQNVLKSYEGKSIVIFGNSFPYFGSGDRNPWDLLDPWETGLLEKAGSSILFTSVGNLPSLNAWVGKMTFPANDLTSGAHSINSTNAKELISELKKTDSKTLTSHMVVHRFSVEKSTFNSLPKSVDLQAKFVVKRLDKNMPLKRFIAFQDSSAFDATGKKGCVVVCEGVPKNSNMIASVDQFPAFPAGPHIIADYQLFLIVSSIPFKTRVTMFWNMVGHAGGAGVPCEIIYSGLETFYNSVSGQSDALDKKILEAISLSLQRDLNAEIYHFTSSKPRFPDPIEKAGLMHHLTLTTTFFNAAPKNPIFASPETAQLFVFTLGAVHALSNPLDFWQSFKSAFAFLGNRKGRLTPQLNQHIFGTITALCAPAVAESVKDYVLQRSKQVKAGIRAVGGKRRYEGFGQSELAAFANTAFNCIDLTECCTGSLALGGGAAQQFVQTYCMDRDNRSKWVMDANKLLREMVNPVDEDA